MDNHLAIAMSTAVPLHIFELQEAGGPTEEDMKCLHGMADDLGSRGDILLFGGKRKGECAELFNRTARAIAIMAFVPGGIRIFGQHFEARPREGKA